MLDAFLEVVSGHAKVAAARGQMMASLERLPSSELRKIASGEAVPKAASEDGTSWLEKFRGSPLFDQALELEKEDLDIQMQEQHRRQVESEMRSQLPTWDETDLRRTNLSIKRKLLELDLAGAALDGASPASEGLDASGGQEGEDAVPPDLEAADVAAPPPELEADPAHASAGPPLPPPPADAGPLEDAGPPPPVAAKGPPSDSAEDKPAPKAEGSDEGPPPPKDKSEDKKPPVTKVTTVEKPTEPKEKVDIKQAAARMRLALAAHVTKEAQPATRALAFRR